MDEYSAPLDLTFAALAHPTRRRMLEILGEHQTEMRVTDLAARFPNSLNVASRHIKSLERAKLVKRRRDGRIHHLHIDPAPLSEAADFINRYRKRWERQLDRLALYLNKLQGEQDGK
jgi:DNA-binding transcriptional ArsR family regulator